MQKVREEMRTNDMKVTVVEVIELINKDTVFHAKELANKDRCAVYDRNNKKCAEIAYRNKTATFSIALQCNRFDSKRVKEVADMYDTEYKYHSCKNHRDYITVNKNDSDDTLNYMFELLDTVIDEF